MKARWVTPLLIRDMSDPYADKESRKIKDGRGRGTAKTNPNKAAKAERQAKGFIVISPEGIEQRIHNLAKFSREHDLDPCCMGNVSRGKAKAHRGWKCRKVEEQDGTNICP